MLALHILQGGRQSVAHRAGPTVPREDASAPQSPMQPAFRSHLAKRGPCPILLRRLPKPRRSAPRIGQRPPAPWRPLRSHPSGRWPAVPRLLPTWLPRIWMRDRSSPAEGNRKPGKRHPDVRRKACHESGALPHSASPSALAAPVRPADRPHPRLKPARRTPSPRRSGAGWRPSAPPAAGAPARAPGRGATGRIWPPPAPARGRSPHAAA